MWKEKIEKIIEEKQIYNEKVNKGANKREVQLFKKRVNEELNIILPEEYLRALEVINGIEFNGFIVYGIDGIKLDETPNQYINGLIEYNKIWYENKHQRRYIFLGESNISWYVYDEELKKYYELDNPSGRIIEEFKCFEFLMEKLLSDALL